MKVVREQDLSWSHLTPDFSILSVCVLVSSHLGMSKNIKDSKHKTFTTHTPLVSK